MTQSSPTEIREVPANLHFVERNEDLVAKDVTSVFLFVDPENDRVGVRTPDGFVGGFYYISLKQLKEFLERNAS